MNTVERVIWSADVQEHEIVKYLDLMPNLKRIKLDRLFVERHGIFALALCRDRGIEVFYDAKYIEIPSKLEDLAREGVKQEPWMLNCMAGAVSNGGWSTQENRDLMDGLKRFADVCHSSGVRPCGVTVLTSKTEEIAKREFNGRDSTEQVLEYVDMLLQAGFTDVVCSPRELPELLAVERFRVLNFNCPGVRFAGSDAGDQARVSTPGSTISWGAATVIMGRDLTKGDDPGANFARAVAEIDAALAPA